MSARVKNMREVLLLAGITEINTHGVTGFSIRRVATACGVSCAAPYKHFKDKKEFIASIIEFVNDEWRQRQEEILAACGSPRVLNIALLAAAAKAGALGITPDELRTAVRERLPEKFHALNLGAIDYICRR